MRILFVADKTNPNDTLKQNLVRRGYEVDYLSYRDIIRRVKNVSYPVYDLILMHWGSVDDHALNLCRNIRKQNTETPILVFSENFTDTEKVIALDAGATVYHGSPFSLERLNEEIIDLTQKPAAPLTSQKLEIGELVLDTKVGKASLGSRIVQLTDKEFSLLEFLMRNVGHIVTREKIIDNVWDFGSGAASNVIDVHIKNIRKKIKSKYSATIETVRAAGYRIMGRPK
ncbi:MAG: response regulator transcription factor [bacterium]|nr:response regulator transcription factor [bacterium]